MAAAPPGIDISWLMKFIRKQIDDFPAQFLPQLEAEELTVTTKLTVVDQVEFKAHEDWSFVGATGKPPFTNSWVSYGAPYANAAYMLLPDGFVQLHGVIKLGTLGSSAFTLPPGFRPTAPTEFLVLSNGAAGRVTVGSDGTVTPVAPSTNASVVLDQIRFKAA